MNRKISKDEAEKLIADGLNVEVEYVIPESIMALIERKASELAEQKVAATKIKAPRTISRIGDKWDLSADSMPNVSPNTQQGRAAAMIVSDYGYRLSPKITRQEAYRTLSREFEKEKLSKLVYTLYIKGILKEIT